MAEKKEIEVINIKRIVHIIVTNRKKYYLPLGIVFVLSCVYIFSKPRFYTTEAKLVPELESSMNGGTLGSIASAFGFDFGDMQTTDAITPLLYPELLEDNAFVSNLFDVEVEIPETGVKTTYYEYLQNYQKKPWWNGITSWISSLFKSDSKDNNGENSTFDPYALSKKENVIAAVIRDNVQFSIDKKTGVITIVVKDQDRNMCRAIADTVIVSLQSFITDYRTNKSRRDLEYYTSLVDSAEHEYLQACQAYSSFTDAFNYSVIEEYRTKQNILERDMQLKYTTYSTLVSQKEMARGKLQERTPAFTVLKGASVPELPAGPKRVRFVLVALFVTFVVISAWIVRKDINLKF